MRLQPALLALVLLSACAAAPAGDGDAFSSASQASSSVAASSIVSSAGSGATSVPDADPPFDARVHSGSYINAAAGFALTYPTHFEPFGEPLWEVFRQHNSRIVNGVLEHDRQDSTFAVSARDREMPSDFSVTIATYPLEGYSYVNIYDDEYAYDLKTDTWRKVRADEAYKPLTVEHGGQTMYSFAFGDAGHFVRTFAIFNKAKNTVVELSAGGCLGCIRGEDGFEDLPQETYDLLQKHADADTNAMLDGFRWLD